MKGFIAISVFIQLVVLSAAAQGENVRYLDSLSAIINNNNQDTIAVKAFLELSDYYDYKDTALSRHYARQGLDLSQKTGFTSGQVRALQLLGWSYLESNEFVKSLQYYDRALQLVKQSGEHQEHINILIWKGNMAYRLGEINEALQNFDEAFIIALSRVDTVAILNMSIYLEAILERNPDVLDFVLSSHLRAKPLLDSLLARKADSSLSISALRNNFLMQFGNLYSLSGNDSAAIYYYNIAISFTPQSPFPRAGIAKIYLRQGELERAKNELKLTRKLALKDDYAYSVIQAEKGLAAYYFKKQLMDSAIYKHKIALRLLQQTGGIWKDVEKEIYEGLHTEYAAVKQTDSAYKYLTLSLSITDEEAKDWLKLAEYEKHRSQKEEYSDYLKLKFRNDLNDFKIKKEIDLAKEESKRKFITYGATGGGFILLVALVLFYRRNRFISKTNAIITAEKERSERLLLNILPEEVAEELKEKGKSEARDFENVTVLFTDFLEFTETAEKLSAKELVKEINACFEKFDSIITKYNLEKIKTIGDAYMAAGGLHVPRTSETVDVVNAAIEMQMFMIKRKQFRDQKHLPAFEMRVGIHTGPVVAGIVGVKKFQYDIWGDTVNTASRMESNGEVGKVNISHATYELIKDDSQFIFESRGKVAVKGKGEMEMWFVGKA